MTSNTQITLLFILLPFSFIPSYGWLCSDEFAREVLVSAIHWYQKKKNMENAFPLEWKIGTQIIVISNHLLGQSESTTVKGLRKRAVVCWPKQFWSPEEDV